MPTLVHDLELPELDLVNADRAESLAAIEAAREQHWLARTPMGYLVSRYDDVHSLLRERRFHSALAVVSDMSGIQGRERQREQKSILSMEGEEHTRLRRLVSPTFTPRSTEKLRPFMREVVNDLVDQFAARGTCDLVADVCEPYPIPIICELLGAPKEDWKLFSNWATDIFRIFNNDLETDFPKIEAAGMELDAYVTAMIDERRSSPADDLLSRLIAVEEEGDRLSTSELVMMTEAVLMAGTDTTRNQLACSVALLAQAPDQWELLRQRPELAPNAVEETMRLLGAVRGTARFASEDIVFRDVLFPQGTFVAASLGAANTDEDVWPDAHRFDISRPPAGSPQMTFGSGVHYCLGANLARAELQEALVILSQRMPDLALDGPIEWKPDTFGIWGPAKLPLRFTPAT